MATAPSQFSAGLERHIQTIALFVITSVLAFTANTLWQQRTDNAVVSEQLKTLSQQIVELRADVKAMQGNYVTREDYRDHEGRIRALEMKKK